MLAKLFDRLPTFKLLRLRLDVSCNEPIEAVSHDKILQLKLVRDPELPVRPPVRRVDTLPEEHCNVPDKTAAEDKLPINDPSEDQTPPVR